MQDQKLCYCLCHSEDLPSKLCTICGCGIYYKYIPTYTPACKCYCHQDAPNQCYLCLCTCDKATESRSAQINIETVNDCVEKSFKKDSVELHNLDIFKESIKTHIYGINKIVNLYKSNDILKNAGILLNVTYDLIIKGLAANDG